ncbi:Phytanoyl-CoA dioxygenase (PhyH) [Pseudovibrio axinellae]|uniref:Phytanoyl-CoA dioxygenase (PhyH) n=1 Tax=Pseudovibrio axinellae TaxID=989403 RepID=A0A165ZT08_9HYPH|nr:phytanoyl-CoA dioxygenase family protein [Pseudovibrio axinellae]KZL20242.1 Phytanoyl-CoA dioxygenase (PhyH) [Pseudovibrio axinellae]SEQ62377.1 Phytanoyl-CoA dioxygenase (PhyH) [Pseudovibrio axinellae]
MTPLKILKSPLWIADIALGGKSFRDNPIIGNRSLNERGFHVQRMAFAEHMADMRRRQIEHFLPADDRKFFHENGYVVRHNALPDDVFRAVQEELEDNEFAARELKQGRTVTRFIGLTPSILAKLPGLRAAVGTTSFQQGLRYVASNNADPLVYLHTVLWDMDDKRKDPQTNFHSDTFHSIAKAWLFLKDVELADGPFQYVPGSHRLNAVRRRWEYEQSLIAASHRDGNHAVGSFRITENQLQQMGYSKPVSFAVPANTLVIADTHGFHARGIATRPGLRIGMYGSVRRSPFLPWAGGDMRSLPGIKGHQTEIFGAYLDWRRRKGNRVSHVGVGKVKATQPAVR